MRERERRLAERLDADKVLIRVIRVIQDHALPTPTHRYYTHRYYTHRYYTHRYYTHRYSFAIC